MPQDFVQLAEQVVDDLLAASPTLAYWSGDHRSDDRLPDLSDDAVRREADLLARRAKELAEINSDGLGADDEVDRQLLTTGIAARRFVLTELEERTWNPLLHNPGDLIYGLLAREIGEPDERLTSLAGRLAAMPEALATAARVLRDCPRVHVETALTRLEGTTALVRDEVPQLLNRAPGLRGAVEPARDAALVALARHRDFLTALLPRAHRDPRLGRPLWNAQLRHALDSDLAPADVLTRARSGLDRLTAEITEAAVELTGTADVPAALAQLARDHPDDDTIVFGAQHALADASDFVQRHQLVTVLDDPLEIMTMPEHARGVAVAYCDAPGPLETRVAPTFFAISPTPADWPAERVESFYREYNNHMLANLTAHEAMPGHFLQLAHARRYRGNTRVRAVCQSGSFIEGWAVYSEEVMVEHGFGALPVRMQQLKMQLRMIINAILDQMVHCESMTETEGMALMTERGFQEEGEASGKWRRALLTSTQLSTYFVGYTEVAQLGRSRPEGTSLHDWHDAMLSHGSIAPRHVRRLLAG